MNIHQTRKVLLKVFIGFLSLTALIAIASVLIGAWGGVQLKTLATTFTISAASICAMACAAFVEKRGQRKIGGAGALLNFVAAAVVIAGVWLEADSQYFWKFAVTFIVVALGVTHGCLLHLPTLAEKFCWTQQAAIGVIALLAAMIVAAFWGEIDATAYYRILAVVSIITVLFTLVIPILMKLAPSDDVACSATTAPEVLALTQVDGNVFQDAHGARFRVEQMQDT